MEFLARNAGKDRGYFQIPSFMTKKQSLKMRVKDLKMAKKGQWNSSLKIAKPIDTRRNAGNMQK